MATLPVTDNTCMFGPVSKLAPGMQMNGFFCHSPPLTLPEDCSDGAHLLRLPASLQAKQVEQAMALGLQYMGLVNTGISADLLSSQMPAMPDSLQLRKILLQSDLLKKINELQQLDQLLMGNSLEYGVIGGQEPAVFGSYETLPSLTAHRSTPLPGNPFDLASLQREQPLTPLPLNTKRLSRRTSKAGNGLEAADTCVPRKPLRSSTSVPTPPKSAHWVNPTREARPVPPPDAAKAAGTGVFLPPPSSGTGVFVPTIHLPTKVAQKERGGRISRAGEANSPYSDSASTTSSFDYLPEVSELESPKSCSPPAPSTPQGRAQDRIFQLPDKWEYKNWGLA